MPKKNKSQLSKILRSPQYLIAIFLMAWSIYFYIGVENFRANLYSTNPDAFSEGDIITIDYVVDGDEITVSKSDGSQTLVRLLGVRSFDPFVNKPGKNYGEVVYNYLKNNTLGKRARIYLDKTKVDSSQRLLAYLLLEDDNGQFSIDLNKELVRSGMTLVYTKYPFERMRDYLRAEKEAYDNKAQIWSDPNVTELAQKLKEQWKAGGKK